MCHYRLQCSRAHVKLELRRDPIKTHELSSSVSYSGLLAIYSLSIFFQVISNTDDFSLAILWCIMRPSLVFHNVRFNLLNKLNNRLKKLRNIFCTFLHNLSAASFELHFQIPPQFGSLFIALLALSIPALHYLAFIVAAANKTSAWPLCEHFYIQTYKLSHSISHKHFFNQSHLPAFTHSRLWLNSCRSWHFPYCQNFTALEFFFCSVRTFAIFSNLFPNQNVFT